MIERWRQLLKMLEALNPRELWLVFITGVVAIIVLGQIIVIDPINRKIAHEQEQISQHQSEIDANVIALNALIQERQKAGDALASARSEVTALQKNIEQTEEQIKQLSGERGLIGPAEMSKALEALLRANTQLKLTALTTRKSVALSQEQANPLGDIMPQVVGQPNTVTPKLAAPDSQLYEHGITIEFTGSYLDTLNYLRTVEQLPWRFSWSELEIKMESYPQARIRIELKTRSLSPEVMGV